MMNTLERTQRIAAASTVVANEVAGLGAAKVPASASSSGRRRGDNEIDPNVGVDAPDGHESAPPTGVISPDTPEMTKRSRRDSRERPATDYAGGGVDGHAGADEREMCRPPGVAQPGRAPGWNPEGRQFEPDPLGESVIPARQQPSSPVGQPGAGGDRYLLPQVICQRIRAAVQQGLTLYCWPNAKRPRIVACDEMNRSCGVVIVRCDSPGEISRIYPSIEAEMKHWLAVKADGGDMEAAI